MDDDPNKGAVQINTTWKVALRLGDGTLVRIEPVVADLTTRRFYVTVAGKLQPLKVLADSMLAGKPDATITVLDSENVSMGDLSAW